MTIDNKALRYLLDPYLDWCAGENIPIVEAIGLDLFAIETAPWPRLGKDARGAFVHLAGRGDFVSLQVIDLPPGGRTELTRHLFDEVFFILSGHGSTSVEVALGKTVSFEWGPRSLFSPPLNARYALLNGSGIEHARIICGSNLPFAMNFFRNERFLFDNPHDFPERVGAANYYSGEGEFLSLAPGKHMWETNFVPDLVDFALPEWEEQGTGSRNIKIILADNAMHTRVSEMPVGAYKKGHRHGAGAHVFALTGTGYTLLWREDADFERQEWHFGTVFSPPDGMFHQHFNTGHDSARYLAISLGSHRYPIFDRKVKRKSAPNLTVREGGSEIAYSDQDPRIHRLWLAELAARGIDSKMDRHFNEDAIRPERA